MVLMHHEHLNTPLMPRDVSLMLQVVCLDKLLRWVVMQMPIHN